MSVELQEQRERYEGNGTATTFPFRFTIEDEHQVRVVQGDTQGTEKDLAFGTDYTVVLNSDGTGSVTLNEALPKGYALALLSAIPATQERAFYNNTPYYQEQIEGGLDKTTRLIQQIQEKVERSVKLPPTDPRTPDQYAQDLLAGKEEAQRWAEYAEAQAGRTVHIPSETEVLATGSTTPRPLTDRFADVVNVKDFGAVGDGVTDDSQAFIDAYNYAVSIGTRPFVPYGNYKLGKNVPSVQAGTFYCEGIEPKHTPGKALIVTRPLYDNEVQGISAHARSNFRKAYRLKDPAKVQALLTEAAKLKKYIAEKGFTYGHYNTIPMDDATTIDCSGYCFWALYNIGFTDLAGMQPYEHQDQAQTAFFEARPDEFQKITHMNDLHAGDIVFSKTSTTKWPWHGHMYIFVDRNTGYSAGGDEEISQAGVVRQQLGYLGFGGSTFTGVNRFVGGKDYHRPIAIQNDAVTKNAIPESVQYVSIQFVDSEFTKTSEVVDNHGVQDHQVRLSSIARNGNAFGIKVTQRYSDDRCSITLVANDTGATTLIVYPSSVYVEGQVLPMTDNKYPLGNSAQRWSEVFAAADTINTSDAREKVNLADPNEALMRAWGKVNFKSFQLADAVEKKGEGARIHFGVIAQQVAEAFASEGLDAYRYALFCYDKWDDEWEEFEVVDKEEVVDSETGEVLEPRQTHTEKRLIHKAGDRYGIRYSEALALECAYQRWRLAKLEAKLNG